MIAALVDHALREIGDVFDVSKQAIFQQFGEDSVVSRTSRMAEPEWQQAVKRKLSGE